MRKFERQKVVKVEIDGRKKEQSLSQLLKQYGEEMTTSDLKIALGRLKMFG